MLDMARLPSATGEPSTSLRVAKACESIQQRLSPELRGPPSIGIVCGSGLGGLADVVLPQPRCDVDYRDIPYFPCSTGTLTSLILLSFIACADKLQSKVILES